MVGRVRQWGLIAVFAAGSVAWIVNPCPSLAMPMKSQMLKSKAKFIEGEKGLLEPLDLKIKTLTFGKSEFDQCGAALVRKTGTLSYSCALSIPSSAKISKLYSIDSGQKMEIAFGASQRTVNIEVSPDAKSITFTTAFDHSGMDMDMNDFNQDFFPIFNKVAQLVISQAMGKQPIRIEVLENNL